MSTDNKCLKRRLSSLQLLAAVFTVTGIAALSGCASITPINVKTNEGTMKIHEVKITRQAVIPGSTEAVFDFIAAEGVLPHVLTGYGPLPAVVRTSGNTGAWNVPGSARRIHLADESTLQEQVTHYTRPEHFAYRVWDFGNPILRMLATGARGEWTFVPADGGTLATWTYTFTAKNAAAAIPLSVITQLLWRGYMDVCLENSQKLMLAKQ